MIRRNVDFTIPQIRRGSRLYQKDVSNSTYKLVTKTLKERFGERVEEKEVPTVGDAIVALLYDWNGAFYRYGGLDDKRLNRAITRNKKKILEFRQREIESLTDADTSQIKRLFGDFLKATSRVPDGAESPVGVAKALHLLAPDFFPLWDNKIARKFGYRLYGSYGAADKYIQFMRTLKPKMAAYRRHGVTLKMLDEACYERFTQTPTNKRKVRIRKAE